MRMHEKRILPGLLVKNHVAFVLLVLVQALAPAQTFPVEDPVIKRIWAVEQYREWGIEATNEQYGTWRGWERGVSRIDLMQPRVRTLEGTMLAWSPATKKGGVTAPLLILGDNADSAAFVRWLPSVRGKFVLISQPQPTGRPDKNWEEFATKESFDGLIALRDRIKANRETGRVAEAVDPERKGGLLPPSRETARTQPVRCS
jgi:hypothetical protein